MELKPPRAPLGFKSRAVSSVLHVNEAQHAADDGRYLPVHITPTRILAQASCFDSATGGAAPKIAATTSKASVCPDPPQAFGFWEKPEVLAAISSSSLCKRNSSEMASAEGDEKEEPRCPPARTTTDSCEEEPWLSSSDGEQEELLDPASMACHQAIFDPAQERSPELAMNPMLLLGRLAEAAEMVACRAPPADPPATKRRAAKRAAETIGAYAATELGSPPEGKWGGGPSNPSCAINNQRKRGRQILPDPQVTAPCARPGLLMGKYPETMADSAIAVKEGVCRTTVWRRRQKELADQRLSGAKPDRNVSWGHDLAMMGSQFAVLGPPQHKINRPRLSAKSRVVSEEV